MIRKRKTRIVISDAKLKHDKRAYRQQPENLSEINAGLEAGLIFWEKENWCEK